MASQERPLLIFGAVLNCLASGCTSFVGADEGTAGQGESVSDAAGGSTAGSETTNPTAGSASTTASSSSSTSASSTAAPTGDPTRDSASTSTTRDETTTGPDTATVSATGADASSATTSSDSNTGAPSSSSSTGDPIDPLGMTCAGDGDCAEDDGQECCTANECSGLCMVPCSEVSDCPLVDMGCEHGYCLFPCDNNDKDCADWPGTVCDHGGTLCESD